MNLPQALARGLSALVLVAAFAPLPTLGVAQKASAAERGGRPDADRPNGRPVADTRAAKPGSIAIPAPKRAAATRLGGCHQCELVAATSLFRASMTGLFEAPE